MLRNGSACGCGPQSLGSTPGFHPSKEEKMNILFVCKHNVFRSKVAEAYFRKVNKNKEINVNSAGIIKVDVISEVEKKLIRLQRKIAKEFGINIKNGSRQLNVSLLKKQDIIFIVADDVSKKIFNSKFYLKPKLKIIVWKIPDVKGEKNDKEIIKNSIKTIIKNVDKLVEELK